MSYSRDATAPRSLARTCTAIAVIAMVVCFDPAYAGNQDKSIIGKWKLTAVLDSSEITALDDDQAQNLVGQTFSIQADKVQFGQRMCKSPDFEVSNEETSDYFARHAHASADKLGLPNPVTVVHIDCTYVYKKAPDKIVIHWKGFYFDAVRVGLRQR